MTISYRKTFVQKVELLDVTDDYCVLGVFGPKSIDLMKELSNDDYSNINFKFEQQIRYNRQNYSMGSKIIICWRTWF